MSDDKAADGAGYQGECKVCGWKGTLLENHADAEAEAAEHAGYCAASDPSILARCEECGRVAYPAEDHAECVAAILARAQEGGDIDEEMA